MVDREGKPGNAVRPRMGPHEEFLELCALSTTGCLTAEERNRLRQHLAVCADCRKAMEQFEAVIDKAIPALAPGLSGDIPEESSSFSVEKAEASFFKRLSEESTEGAKRPGEAETLPRAAPFPTRTSFPGRLDRFHFWLPLAAVFLLCVTLGILTYRMGIHRGADVAREELGTGGVAPAPVFETAEAVSRDRDTANAQLAERSKTITELRTEMAVQSGEIAKLKALESGQERTAQTGEEEKKQLAEERDHLAQELEMKQEALQASEKKLDALEQQRSEDLAHAAGLEAKLEDLSRAVRDQEHTTDQQRELLSHDRDIRELMGARDLYVAEVYDVERKGETQKAFGRVFYTKGKSLIFYGYDLNDAPGYKNASTFQAWGWRGPDRTQALNLGIFYQDNDAKKRWVLKFNDAKTLQQIDAVFVTVEPHGGSEKPSGKPLLFAYLKVNANHP
jgi:hypothetical protein